MTPYYQQQGVTIYHGDCVAVLGQLEANIAHLIVTDPPYGVSFQSNVRAEKFGLIAGDDSTDAAVVGLSAALRVLMDKRHVYAFGRYDLSGLPLTTPVELIWDKGCFNGGDLSQPWANQHEYIQFCTLRRANTERRRVGEGLAARLRKGSVLRYQRPSGTAVNIHPTEKPVMLLRDLIESSSRIGEMVLDPFCGVGSTLVAAVTEGRRAIGIEIEERYAEIAARRLSQPALALSA